MPRELFGEVVHPAGHVGGKRWFSLPLTISVHAAILAVVVIVPVLATAERPSLPGLLSYPVRLEAPDPPPLPPPPARPANARPALTSNPDAAPVVAQAGITPETGIVRDPEPSAVNSVPGGLPGTVEGAGVAVQPEALPSLPPAPVPVGGKVLPPARLRYVAPEYPAAAIAARFDGTVIVEATIDVNGRVTNARVLRSRPLLDQAAIDAVRQWTYTPTRLNGVPVAVLMTVTVTFTLR